jgi:hypothetical protein
MVSSKWIGTRLECINQQPQGDNSTSDVPSPLDIFYALGKLRGSYVPTGAAARGLFLRKVSSQPSAPWFGQNIYILNGALFQGQFMKISRKNISLLYLRPTGVEYCGVQVRMNLHTLARLPLLLECCTPPQ